MAVMKAPHVPEEPVPVVSDDQLKRLFKVCQGTSFEQRRDLAIIRVFYACGLRLSGLTGLRLDDVDWDLEVLCVVGMGRRPRAVPFTPKASNVLDAYLRARRKHPGAASPMLWLGEKGPLGTSGLAQMLRRRCRDAGIPSLHPHQLRHTAAHEMFKEGIGDSDAMRLFGWRSPQMLNRYGASAADERARDGLQSAGRPAVAMQFEGDDATDEFVRFARGPHASPGLRAAFARQGLPAVEIQCACRHGRKSCDQTLGGGVADKRRSLPGCKSEVRGWIRDGKGSGWFTEFPRTFSTNEVTTLHQPQREGTRRCLRQLFKHTRRCNCRRWPPLGSEPC